MSHINYSRLEGKDTQPVISMAKPTQHLDSSKTTNHCFMPTNGFGLSHPDKVQYVTLKTGSMSFASSESSGSLMEIPLTDIMPLMGSGFNDQNMKYSQQPLPNEGGFLSTRISGDSKTLARQERERGDYDSEETIWGSALDRPPRWKNPFWTGPPENSPMKDRFLAERQDLLLPEVPNRLIPQKAHQVNKRARIGQKDIRKSPSPKRIRLMKYRPLQ